MRHIESSDNTTIHVEEAGDGVPVMLVHGITESSATWSPIVDRLAGSNRVVTLDLRGHGQSGTSDRYDLEAMASDVAAVAKALELDRPHLVGHSLGGAVVSAVGAVLPVRSVTNVDQSLQLGSFKAQLMPVRAMLEDPATFPAVIDGLFDQLAGSKLAAEERSRVNAARRANQAVVLAVWQMMFTMSEDEIAAVVDGALAGYAGSIAPYLALFGADPGEGYAEWLNGHIANSTVEIWDDHGHYPHLVDPDRFVDRLRSFWDA